jgi:acyl-CoA thioesterase FadM
VVGETAGPEGGAPWSGFRFVQDVVPSGHRIHVHNLAIAELLFNGRNSYIADGVGLAWQRLFDTQRNLVMRRLVIDYEREAHSGVPVKVGVRAAGRSRRTLTLDEVVWEAESGLPIAVAQSVHLVVRLDAQGAIDLPDDVVERFEAYEGRPLSMRLSSRR